MADAERVTARQRAILTAIIESYIETGEPVGSGTIARLQNTEGVGLSSATVRNEMAELAEGGSWSSRIHRPDECLQHGLFGCMWNS